MVRKRNINLRRISVTAQTRQNENIDFPFLLPRYTVYKDHITLGDYEIHDGMSLEMY